jgi:hypothetical protein
MSFSVRPTNDLVRIAAAGGGFRLSAAVRSTDDLVRIAAAASSSGARVSFAGLNVRPTDDLVRIGAAGKGSVSFEE